MLKSVVVRRPQGCVDDRSSNGSPPTNANSALDQRTKRTKCTKYTKYIRYTKYTWAKYKYSASAYLHKYSQVCCNVFWYFTFVEHWEVLIENVQQNIDCVCAHWVDCAGVFECVSWLCELCNCFENCSRVDSVSQLCFGDVGYSVAAAAGVLLLLLNPLSRQHPLPTNILQYPTNIQIFFGRSNHLSNSIWAISDSATNTADLESVIGHNDQCGGDSYDWHQHCLWSHIWKVQAQFWQKGSQREALTKKVDAILLRNLMRLTASHLWLEL